MNVWALSWAWSQKKKKQVDQFTLCADVGDSADLNSTAPSVLTLDAKIVRGTSPNALVTACAMLGESSHRGSISIIVNCCKPELL